MTNSTIDLSHYHNELSRSHQLLRLLWGLVWPLSTWFLPRSAGMPWKRFLLRAFGAKVADTANVYTSVRIFFLIFTIWGRPKLLESDR